MFLVSGMVYPAFGLVYSRGINVFSLSDPVTRRHEGDRIALWCVQYKENL